MANKMLGFWKMALEITAAILFGKGILSFPTGTGKTTQCPQLVYDWLRKKNDNGLILVSVPRRVLAIELARRVAEEMGSTLGELVGYKIRGEEEKSEKTRILFVTEGMLRALIQSNPSLDGVSMILFDEFHQRSLMNDFNVALVERAQQEGSKVKFLLMSATIDASSLAEHFGCSVVDGTVFGTQFAIEERYLDRDPSDLVEAAVEHVQQLVSEQRGNGLVFMPGKGEIMQVVNELKLVGLPSDVTVLPLHGGLIGDDRSAPFRSRKGRTVIIATDIVETGATLPDITWVVDSGLAREVRYDVISDIGGLRLAEVAKDRLKQRRGRCGRVQAGVYVGLFTEFNKNARQAQTTPEIFRKPLREVILTIKSIGLSREGEPIRLLDSPPKANWKQAKAQLQALGFVATDKDANITPLGRKAARMGCDPREAAMLLKAEELGCLQEMAWAVAEMQTSKNLLDTSKGQSWEAEAAHAQFRSVKTCDAWAVVEVCRQVASPPKGLSLGNWCRQNFVSHEALKEVKSGAEQLLKRFKGDAKKARPVTESTLRQAILAGLPDRIFQHDHRDRYTNVDSGDFLILGRESVVRSTTTNMIVASWEAREIQTRAGGTLRLITSAITIEQDAQWLRAALPHLVEVEEGIDPRYEMELDLVTSVTRVRFKGELVSAEERVKNPHHPKAAQVFAQYLAEARDGSVSVLFENQAQVARAKAFNLRAGEEVFEVTNLVDFYIGVCAGARNVGELSKHICSLDDLRLPVLDRELIELVEQEAPESLEILGSLLPVEYSDGKADPRVKLSKEMVTANSWIQLPDEGVRLPGGRSVEVVVSFGYYTTLADTNISQLKAKVREHLNCEQWDAWCDDRPEIALPNVSDDESVIPFVTASYGKCVVTGEPLMAYGTVVWDSWYAKFSVKWLFRNVDDGQRAANEAAVKLESLREEARMKRLAEKAREEAEAVKAVLYALQSHKDWYGLEYEFRRAAEFRGGYGCSIPSDDVDEARAWTVETKAMTAEVKTALSNLACKREEEEQRKVEEKAVAEQRRKDENEAYSRLELGLSSAVKRLRFFRGQPQFTVSFVAGSDGQWINEQDINGSIWDWARSGGAWDQKVRRNDAAVVDFAFVANGRLEVLAYYEHRNDRPSFVLRWTWTGDSEQPTAPKKTAKPKKVVKVVASQQSSSTPPSEDAMAVLLGKWGKKR